MARKIMSEDPSEPGLNLWWTGYVGCPLSFSYVLIFLQVVFKQVVQSQQGLYQTIGDGWLQAPLLHSVLKPVENEINPEIMGFLHLQDLYTHRKY